MAGRTPESDGGARTEQAGAHALMQEMEAHGGQAPPDEAPARPAPASRAPPGRSPRHLAVPDTQGGNEQDAGERASR